MLYILLLYIPLLVFVVTNRCDSGVTDVTTAEKKGRAYRLLNCDYAERKSSFFTKLMYKNAHFKRFQTLFGQPESNRLVYFNQNMLWEWWCLRLRTLRPAFIINKKEKLTGSRNYLFASVYFVLQDEHFFMAAVQTLNFTPVLVEPLFLARHDGRGSDYLHGLQIAANRS